MKKLILGVGLGLFLFPAIHEVSLLIYDKTPIIVEYGFTKPFTKKCIKNEGENGHGQQFVVRDYFSCGKVSIFISDMLWGEYAKK